MRGFVRAYVPSRVVDVKMPEPDARKVEVVDVREMAEYLEFGVRRAFGCAKAVDVEVPDGSLWPGVEVHVVGLRTCPPAVQQKESFEFGDLLENVAREACIDIAVNQVVLVVPVDTDDADGRANIRCAGEEVEKVLVRVAFILSGYQDRLKKVMPSTALPGVGDESARRK